MIANSNRSLRKRNRSLDGSRSRFRILKIAEQRTWSKNLRWISYGFEPVSAETQPVGAWLGCVRARKRKLGGAALGIVELLTSGVRTPPIGPRYRRLLTNVIIAAAADARGLPGPALPGRGQRPFSASWRNSSGTERSYPRTTDPYPTASQPKRSRILSTARSARRRAMPFLLPGRRFSS